MREGQSVRQLKARRSPLSVSFSAEENDVVQRAAYLSSDTVSAYIRAVTLKAARRVVARDDTKRAA